MANTRANKNDNFCVRNIAGTTWVFRDGNKWHRRCGCSSWINHWRTGVLRDYPNIHPAVVLDPPCYVRGCGDRGDRGAHVLQVDGRTSQTWYIVPFCAKHNHYRRTEEVYLRKDAILVLAKQAGTGSRDVDWQETSMVIQLWRAGMSE